MAAYTDSIGNNREPAMSTRGGQCSRSYNDDITLVRDPAVRGDYLTVTVWRRVGGRYFLRNSSTMLPSRAHALQPAMLKLRGTSFEVDEELLRDRPED
jgi:hypothetical protein